MEERTVQTIDQEIEALQKEKEALESRQWNDLPYWKKIEHNLYFFGILLPKCLIMGLLTLYIVYAGTGKLIENLNWWLFTL